MLARTTAVLLLGSVCQAERHFTSTYDQVCQRDSQVAAANFLEGSPLEEEFMEILNSQMCSMNCPCPLEAANNFVDSPDLSYYLRSINDLYFVESGKTFSSFQQCWTERLSQTDLYSEEIVATMNDYLTTMEQLEAEKACSGICDSGLFWFTRPVSIEGPADACIADIVADFDNSISEESDLLVKLQRRAPPPRRSPPPPRMCGDRPCPKGPPPQVVFMFFAGMFMLMTAPIVCRPPPRRY